MNSAAVLLRLRDIQAERRTCEFPGTQAPAADMDYLRRITRLRNTAERVSREPHDSELPGESIAPGLRLIQREVSGPEWLHCADDGQGENTSLLPRLRFDLDRFRRVQPEQLLGIDTETTGLSGGTGTRAFLIGAVDWQGTRLRLRQLLLTELRAETHMLREFKTWLGEDPILLSYNGKSYDLPLLRTRLRLARLTDTTTSLPHLDLLHAVRRRYRQDWPDCRLRTAEQRLLGVLREHDLPGSEAPAAYLRWLRCGDSRGLVQVLEHNAQDLISLAGLAARLGRDDASEFRLDPPRGPYFRPYTSSSRTMSSSPK